MPDLLEQHVNDLCDLGMLREDAIELVNEMYLETLNNHYSEN